MQCATSGNLLLEGSREQKIHIRISSNSSVLMNNGLGEIMHFTPDKKLFRMTFSFVVALVLELCN